ncbi:MAG TPA: tetratricopeptide repeat protein [Rhizomicrobium sp.]|jgi:tetratricopeptide (TPR) repeat protein|nr:tetratricopeptide repeat protein [Rhizomicrobium sp.]
MAEAAVAIGLDQLAGVGAHAQALAKLESLQEEIGAALARRKSNGLVRRAIKAWYRGDTVRAAKLSLEATEADDQNAPAYHVLGMALERMGHTHKALVTYERAHQLNPSDPELLINLGLTAWNLHMREGAEAMFRHYINAKPESPLGYNNLGSIQGDMGRSTLAIETLQNAIYRMPNEAMLWNSLATILAENGRAEESLIFYQEAIRLEPQFSRPYHNLGYAYSHLGRLEEALDAYDSALEYGKDPNERIETLHSRSICLIGMGKLEEAWDAYEIRNSPRFRAYLHNVGNMTLWNGEPLDGKRILVTGEQGLGDEFMFANILPDIQRAVGETGKLQIAVDPRLVTLFQRSYPKAEVGTYDDRKALINTGGKELRLIQWAVKDGKPDFHTPMGSALRFLRTDLSQFPHEPFLTADPERVAEYRKQLEAIGPGPYVGICWRSMKMDVKRKKYYSALDIWGPIFKTEGVTFVNVQYGDCADEIRAAEEKHGVKIHVIDGLDLKNDIDGAAALSTALDLVISAPTAAAATAGAVGTETWFLTAGRTWPQMNTDEFPWYAKSHVFAPENFGDWEAVMPVVAEALAKRADKIDA